MTRADAIRRILGAALVCLGAASMWVRLLGWQTTVGRVGAAIFLTCLAYAIGTAGGARVSRGRGAAFAVIAALAGGLVLGAATMPQPAGQQDSAFSVFFQSLVGWLGTLLSSTVPAPLDAITVTAVIVLSAYATLIACLLVTSARPALALLPALVLLLAATIFSVGSTMDVTPIGIAFAASCLAALSLWPISGKRTAIEDGQAYAEITVRPSPGRGRRIAAAFILGLGLAMVAGLIQGVVGVGANTEELNLKDNLDSHRPNDNGVNPVRKISEWQTVERNSSRNMFTVTATRPLTAVWWAAQETYDGESWGTGEEYRRVDGDIPPGEATRGKFRSELDAAFSVSGLPGPWLPTYNRPQTVTGTASRYSAGGVLSAADDLAAGKIYQTTSEVLALTNLADLESAQRVQLNPSAPTRALPGAFPGELAILAEEVTSGAGSDYAKAAALSDYFTSNFSIEQETADLATDYATLRRVVLESRTGTQGQLASAYALMMRSLGYSTRLATGFEAKGKKGTRVVRSTDGLIWPEVQFRGMGWVPFAAAPGDVEAGVPVPRQVNQPKPDATATPTPTPTTAEPTPTPTPTPTPEPQPNQGSRVPWALLLLALPLAGYLAFVAWRRRTLRSRLLAGDIRRREPRSASEPSAPAGRAPADAATSDDPAHGAPWVPTASRQVAGAWLWAKQGAAHSGQPIAVNADGRDEAPSTVARKPEVSPPELRDLASTTESALYSPTEPTSGDVHTAWSQADAIVGHARSIAGLRGLLRWWLVPMSWALPEDPLAAAADDAETEQSGRRRLRRLTGNLS